MITMIILGQCAVIYTTYYLSTKGTGVWYGQFADDLVVEGIFKHLNITEIRYLDIGAWEPIQDSNTYLFYRNGHRGVLVEPNPAKAEKLRQTRREDKVLNVGIGVTTVKEADYYMAVDEAYSGLNTFSKEWAEVHEKKGLRMKVVRMPLVNINTLIAENFKNPPNYLSVDVEGLDLDILKSLDFEKYRPAVICVETLVVHTPKIDTRIEEFLKTRNYTIRGATIANSIFVADELTAK
jgi:FkbM family methyltransferase